MRVLIAEDDAASRKDLKQTVERFGHECLVARDGVEAWELYQNTPEIDVIISDRAMPGIDGPELCRRVRRISRARYTFFIFMSEIEDEEQPLIGIQVGADDYLTKPVDDEELRARLLASSRIASLPRGPNTKNKPDVGPGLGTKNGKELALRDQNKTNGSVVSKSGSLGSKRVEIGDAKICSVLV